MESSFAVRSGDLSGRLCMSGVPQCAGLELSKGRAIDARAKIVRSRRKCGEKQ